MRSGRPAPTRQSASKTRVRAGAPGAVQRQIECQPEMRAWASEALLRQLECQLERVRAKLECQLQGSSVCPSLAGLLFTQTSASVLTPSLAQSSYLLRNPFWLGWPDKTHTRLGWSGKRIRSHFIRFDVDGPTEPEGGTVSTGRLRAFK